MGGVVLPCAVIDVSMVETRNIPSVMWHKRKGTCDLSKVHPQSHALHRTVGFLSPISTRFPWLASSHRFLKCTKQDFRWAVLFFCFWADLSLAELNEAWVKTKPGCYVQYTEPLCMRVYPHTQCCSSGSQKLTVDGNPWVMYPCTLPTTAEVLTKKLLTWSRRSVWKGVIKLTLFPVVTICKASSPV